MISRVLVPMNDSAAEEQAAPVFEHARETASEYDVYIETAVHLGNPVRAVLNSADDFDAIAIGVHAATLADRLFVGNVTQKVVRQSPVPVIVVR